MKIHFLVILFSFFIFSIPCQNENENQNSNKGINNQFTNVQVMREINLGSLFVIVTASLDARNSGKSTSEYYIALPTSTAEHLSMITSFEKDSKEDIKVLLEKDEELSTKDTAIYPYHFQKPIKPEETIHLDIIMYFTNMEYPDPAEVQQTEAPEMIFEDNILFYSPYKTQLQGLSVALPSPTAEYTKLKPTSLQGNKIMYGPYSTEYEPFSVKDLKVHYQRTQPLPYITKLVRHYIISHWSDLEIRDYYYVTNKQAKLTGPFSRLDFVRNPSYFGIGSYQEIVAILPKFAKNIDYRDEIGNISTSTITEEDEITKLTFKTRFPLFGGWKTDFMIKYNVPMEYFLRFDPENDRYVFQAPFGAPFPFPVDNVEVHVVFPEGAKNIEKVLPFKFDEEYEENFIEFLDLAGRTSLVLKKSNLIPQHNIPVQISYQLNFIQNFHKLFLLIIGFFIFFTFLFLLLQFRKSRVFSN